ncbi:MAG: SdpI family protein [Chitinophagales bacterium]
MENSDLLLLPILLFLIFLSIGWYQSKYPPKSINSLYGYRTARSLKSQKNWDFAQSMSAQMMMEFAYYLGSSLIAISMTAKYLGFPFESIIPLQLVLMVIGLRIMLYLCEKKLEKFDSSPE